MTKDKTGVKLYNIQNYHVITINENVLIRLYYYNCIDEFGFFMLSFKLLELYISPQAIRSYCWWEVVSKKNTRNEIPIGLLFFNRTFAFFRTLLSLSTLANQLPNYDNYQVPEDIHFMLCCYSVIYIIKHAQADVIGLQLSRISSMRSMPETK